MRHERTIVWQRWPKCKPPQPAPGEGVIRLLVSVECESGLEVAITAWDGKRFFLPTTEEHVVAWAMLPEPLAPLPADYWHPEQVYARRFMGEEDEE